MKQESISTVLMHDGGGRAQGTTLTDLVELLRLATGSDEAWVARIRLESRLEADLGVDSLELASLDAALRDRYGECVDLMALLAELDVDQIISLTVGDLLAHVVATAGPGAAGRPE